MVGKSRFIIYKKDTAHMSQGDGFGIHNVDVHGLRVCEGKSSVGPDQYFESINNNSLLCTYSENPS
jgi:hypothetical protein